MMSGLASCTASQNDEDLTDTTSVFRSAMDIYGVEYASDNISDKNNIPSILAEDMCAVLETLRLNSNTQQNCIRTSDNSYEKVIMNGTYQAVTRSSGNEDFALSVALKFSIEKGRYITGVRITLILPVCSTGRHKVCLFLPKRMLMAILMNLSRKLSFISR